ncbi:MAG TPA: methylenetetrahydrofolate reductase [NAD(P)H] [Planctomycetaceae bacterium]|nr:methylenetetrahydrofolate reductase [NAD(P)H] [Planctomycetaceae bacterium]
MRIRDIYQSGRFGLSIEVFPPKSADGDDALLRTLGRLAPYRPAFFSCTYGAGGSTRTRTLDWCVQIQRRFALTATAHFTCVGSTREQLLEWLRLAHDRGLRNIMALRGDPPRGETAFKPVAGGFRYANELVALIRQQFPHVGIGVAGYPEKHLECSSPEIDLENLKRKVDAGADAVFTQLFYDNEAFFRFRERCGQAGINVPLVPGVMPITEFARIQRITQMCGASVPAELAGRLEAVRDDKTAQFEIGVEHAIGQCRELVAAGVPGIHFYVLNRSEACERILEALGLAPPAAACA